jgi:hypothetical protein
LRPFITYRERLAVTLTGAQVQTMTQPQAGTGIPKWRKKIAFWKSEKVHDTATDVTTRWSVDDASFEVSSVTTPVQTGSIDHGSPKKAEVASIASSPSPRPIPVSPPIRVAVKEKAKSATPKIPIIDRERDWAAFSTGTFALQPSSLNGSVVSSLYRDGSTLQSSTMSVESKEKNSVHLTTGSVTSDGVASAYEAATNALQENGTHPTTTTTISETLSPNVQLLHTIETESAPENHSTTCASSCMSIQDCQPAQSYNDAVSSTNPVAKPEIKRAEDAAQNNAKKSSGEHADTFRYNTDEDQRMQHRARLEKIQKQIDDLKYDTDDQGTIIDDGTSKGEENRVSDSMLDKIVYFITCNPKMYMFSSTPTQDDNHTDDGMYLDDGETDESSRTGDDSFSTFGDDKGHEADQENTDDGSFSYMTQSLDTLEGDDLQDTDQDCTDDDGTGSHLQHRETSSLSGSYMDQSHIYLMMTSARQERAQATEIPKSGEYLIAWDNAAKAAKVRENLAAKKTTDVIVQAPPQRTVSSEQAQEKENEPATSFAWIRNLQRQIYPTESQQQDLIGNYDRWLRSIQHAIRTGNVGDFSSREERRAAAEGALYRIRLAMQEPENVAAHNHVLDCVSWKPC